MTLHDLMRFDGPHHQALEVLTVRALERGDLETAFRLADRRCRIRPLPEAYNFVLRAEVLHRMGERAAALADLNAAFQIAPDDLAANRRMLTWGDPTQQVTAAKTLINHEHDVRFLQRAVMILRSQDQTIREKPTAVDGDRQWVSKDHDASSVRILKKSSPILVGLADVVAAPAISKVPSNFRSERAQARPARSATVIVPVYADYEATQKCLEGLVRELDNEPRYDAIIVNDASPDERIRTLIDNLRPRENLQVLTNPHNLGFVGAVNRALKEIVCGDIILLNSDTIIPRGMIERLASVAALSPDIGTVTPLSNNGEFTSFPVPNRPNTAGTEAEIECLDRIAARVNAERVVDIPNGIGFCLYITRGCFNAVGSLSEDYHRGYLEDVDFCLRARLHGFRHVCAASIFVGHVGTRSFGEQKRSLVVRNLEILERRFPAYRRECALFIRADPLKAARQSIEAAIPPSSVPAILLVTVVGTIAEIAQNRARQLMSEGEPAVLILEVRHESGRIVTRLRDPMGAAPQSLEFDLPISGAATELLAYLQMAKLSRIEFFDLARIPRLLVATLLQLSIPHEIYIAHTNLGLAYPAPLTFELGVDASARILPLTDDPFFPDRVVATADRVLVPDAQAEAFAKEAVPNRNIVRVDGARSESVPLPARSRGCPAGRLGLVPIRRTPQDHHFMHDLISGLKSQQTRAEIVVIGSTFDDDNLLRSADVFVTGAVDATEMEALFSRYRFDRLALCVTKPLFGHPILSTVLNSVLPVAYFDWSKGQCPARQHDLPLDPLLSTNMISMQVAQWL